jgi:hypothetical protein
LQQWTKPTIETLWPISVDWFMPVEIGGNAVADRVGVPVETAATRLVLVHSSNPANVVLTALDELRGDLNLSHAATQLKRKRPARRPRGPTAVDERRERIKAALRELQASGCDLDCLDASVRGQKIRRVLDVKPAARGFGDKTIDRIFKGPF